jgi:hypothetical protein
MSELSGQCEDESCLYKASSISIRVFPCLYHCKKMLCIKHLSEHDKYIEKQIQLQQLWSDYSLIFNEKEIQQQIQQLKIKLENYQQLNKEIQDLLLIKHLQNSVENNEKLQMAINTIEKVIEQEKESKAIISEIFYSKRIQRTTIHLGHVDPKIEMVMNEEEDNQPSIDYCN